ncbi:hypothetical protein L1049_023798 [Liquidambar formosana]|uniref:Uncharacterized protein n=1 Tax=Liquidambar formosana TaxID=63359 RepID=A0AAP0RU26_LIQFO
MLLQIILNIGKHHKTGNTKVGPVTTKVYITHKKPDEAPNGTHLLATFQVPPSQKLIPPRNLHKQNKLQHHGSTSNFVVVSNSKQSRRDRNNRLREELFFLISFERTDNAFQLLQS